MINIAKQTDTFVNGLIDTQKQMWNAISESVQNVAGAPSEKRWKEGVDASEKLVHDSLQAQAELRETLVERISDLEALPESAAESIERLQDIADDLTKNQQDLIGNCFDMLRTLDPNRVAGGYSDGFKSAVERIQQLSRKAVEMQMDLVKSWTGTTPKATKSSASSARKKTTRKKS